jgi:hypothetical protein
VHASILSFLFPPVPFLPSLGSGSTSDERMAIRTVFVALRVAFVWTVLSLPTGQSLTRSPWSFSRFSIVWA